MASPSPYPLPRAAVERGMPVGSCMADRLRRWHTTVTRIKREPIKIRSLALTKGEGRGEGGHEPGRHLQMPVTIEVRVLPVSGENRFADGSPLTPPSRPARRWRGACQSAPACPTG